MYSKEFFIFHQIYERIKSSVVLLILSFIGLNLLYFIFRKFVTNIGTFWCYTDLIAAVIIIGIIAFFERLLNENQQLRNQISEKNSSIKERDLNIKQSKIIIKELEKKVEILNEQFKDSIRYNRKTSKNIENQTLKEENEQLQNQILKNLDIINELIIQNEPIKDELFASNELSEKRRKLILIKKKEIKELNENLKIKNEENQQKTEIIKENEKLRNQISIMDTDFQQSTMKMVLLKQSLENELLIKDEQNQEIIKELSKETERIRKNLLNQDIIIFETNKEIKELEKTILKFKNEQKFHQNETLQMKKQIQNQPTKFVQTLPEIFAVCEKCQKKNGEKETELNQKSGISNIANDMSSTSQSIIDETDDDLPPPPPSIKTAKFLDQISSPSKFTSSIPMMLKSSNVFESMKSNVKMPPPIAPKPKNVPSSPAPSKQPPPPPPPSIDYFNKSFSSIQSPSSNITPKRTFNGIHRILSADLQAEIQTPRKLKSVKKEIEERKKAKFQNEKSNEFPDFKTLLLQRAYKVNANLSFEDKENDSDGEEWK